MSPLMIVAVIILPTIVFLAGCAWTGVTVIVKLTAYLTSSKTAQESTAESNKEIANNLAHYMEQTDGTLRNHGERLSVMEYASGVKARA